MLGSPGDEYRIQISAAGQVLRECKFPVGYLRP
jgi:hypothetical protein